MILKEQDIINAIESYRNKWRLSQEKMAELCGMSSSSVYNNWIHNKTKGRIEYLMAFINNTNVSFLNQNKVFTERINTPDHNILEEPTSPDFNNRCTNPDCKKTIKELKGKIFKLLEEINQLKDEKIGWLEQQKGAPPPEKKVGGDVEKPQQTGS